MDERRMDSLRSVSELAKDAEADASRSLQEMRSRVDQAESTLSQLERYRDEYWTQIESEISVPASALVRKRRFVGELGLSIESQRSKVQALAREFGERMAHWQECRAQDLGLDRLISSHEDRMSRRATKREQSESDDRACHRSSTQIDFTQGTGH